MSIRRKMADKVIAIHTEGEFERQLMKSPANQ